MKTKTTKRSYKSSPPKSKLPDEARGIIQPVKRAPIKKQTQPGAYDMEFSVLTDEHVLPIPTQVFSDVCGFVNVKELVVLRSVCVSAYLGVKQHLEMDAAAAEKLYAYLMRKLSESDISGKVCVSVRVRPSPTPWCVEMDRKIVKSEHNDAQYLFDNVFQPGATQFDVYSKVSNELFTALAKRKNVCIFAYGQTGAGKTHTMFGSTALEDGIAFRVVSRLGEDSPFWSTELTSTRLSFVEVYNEKVHDLLSEKSTELKLSTDKLGDLNIEGVRHVNPRSSSEWREWVRRGSKHRASGKTVFNERSSRSHAIATVRLTWRTGFVSKLHLVDLAGSERAGKYALDEKSLTEGTHINRSLTTLARVVSTVTNGKGEHVPIRDSVLTQILADSIAGQDNSKSFMFAAVNPCPSATKETSSTLQYAYQYSALRSPLPRLIQEASQEQRATRRKLDSMKAAFAKSLSDQRIDEKIFTKRMKERRVRVKHKRDDVEANLADMAMQWSNGYQKKLSHTGKIVAAWGQGAEAAYQVLFDDNKLRWFPVNCLVEEKTNKVLRKQKEDIVKNEEKLAKQLAGLKSLKSQYARLLESWQREA